MTGSVAGAKLVFAGVPFLAASLDQIPATIPFQILVDTISPRERLGRKGQVQQQELEVGA
jgi:hypothetical protein